MGRKRKLTIYDIGSLKSTPVIDHAQPRQSLKRFQREEEARITTERETRVEAARLAELTSPASQKIAMYFCQELRELVINGLDMAPADHFGDYETGPRGDNALEAATWRQFRDNLKSSGCNLSDAGGERLGWFLCCLAFYRGVSLTSVANWQTALERLHSLGVFQSDEIQGYQRPTQTVVQQPSQPAEVDPLAEIESLNLDSREGNRRAKEIATNDFFGRQMAPIADQWRDWLQTTFNYVLTDDARKAAGQWWLANPTLSPLTASSWTQLRLNLVKRGVMPASCKTSEELLLERIEASSERGDSYDTRRNLRQQIRELAQK